MATATVAGTHPVDEVLPVPQMVVSGLQHVLGIRTLSHVDFDGSANLVIVALSLGMGIIPIAVPDLYDEFPDWFTVVFDSGITAAAITAVLLNWVFNIVGRESVTEGPIFAEGRRPPPSQTRTRSA